MYIPMTMRDEMKHAFHPNNNVRRGESCNNISHGHGPPDYHDQVYQGGFGSSASQYEAQEQGWWEQPAPGGMLNWGGEAEPEQEPEQEADAEPEADQEPEYDPGGINRFVIDSVASELFDHIDPPDRETLFLDHIRAEMGSDPEIYREQEMDGKPEMDLEGLLWSHPFQ